MKQQYSKEKYGEPSMKKDGKREQFGIVTLTKQICLIMFKCTTRILLGRRGLEPKIEILSEKYPHLAWY